MWRAALCGIAIASSACVGVIPSGGGGGDDPDASSPSIDASAPTPADAPASARDVAIARGMEWVKAQVPYCQAANHQHDDDSDCASTCDRPDVPAWDPYRSDCSGFVSWSWGLPAPGRVTGEFAPFETDITHAIDASDLAPGDAVNNSDHIMMFEKWVTVGSLATFMEEPGCAASEPYAREITEGVTLDGQSITVDYEGTFTAIRYLPDP